MTAVFGGFSGFTKTPTTAAPSAGASSIFAFLSQDQKDPLPSAKATEPEDKDKEYHQKLKSLNLALCDWVKKHVEKDPVCILTPIFQDYEKHLRAIQGKEQAVTFAVTSKIPVEVKAPPTTTSSSLFFGGASSVAAKTPALFSTEPDKLVPAASTGFSFGGTKPFSFSNTSPATPAVAPGSETAEAGDDDDEPPKVEFKAVVEEDAVFSKRCKVYFKVDENFQERGIGTIFVKPVKDSQKHQMIVRADTSLGNILVNVLLTKGMPVKKMGSNNVMLVCIPNTDFDKPVSVLLKVKTASDAAEVIDKFVELSTD